MSKMAPESIRQARLVTYDDRPGVDLIEPLGPWLDALSTHMLHLDERVERYTTTIMGWGADALLTTEDDRQYLVRFAGGAFDRQHGDGDHTREGERHDHER